MKRIRFILILLISVLSVSCEKAVDWEIKQDNITRLIVDGILTNEFKAQQVRLSFSTDTLNEIPKPASDAVVTVTYNNNTYFFVEDQDNPGIYTSEPFIAVVEMDYHLVIQTDSVLYEATSYAVPVTNLKQIQLAEEPDSLFSYINTDDTRATMTEVFYDWSTEPSYCELYGQCQAAETYYFLNSVDINQAFGPEKQKIKFPKETIIIRKKYSLTEEHQDFIRSLLIETDWRGGLFDVQQGNVETNMSNGALGYFAVCMVKSDTTLVE